MYTRKQLESMTVPKIKELLRKHNLHTSFIKGYSKLKKTELIQSFLRHYPKVQNKKRIVPTPVKQTSKSSMQGMTAGQRKTADRLKDLEERVKSRKGKYAKDDVLF